MLFENYTQIALNFLLGLGVGCYGSLVGVGGGFLLVPIFLLAHRLPHGVAVGTSLAIVTLNAISGTLGYLRQGRIDMRAGVTFSLATFPGAIVGAYFTSKVSGDFFFKIFGFSLLLVSAYLLFRKPLRDEPSFEARSSWGWVVRNFQDREGKAVRYQYFEPLGLLISIGVGAVSSLLGIGGGIIHVPAMTEILRFPVHIAVATSQFVLAWTALVGTFMHAGVGNWNATIAISAGAGAVLGAQLGVRLAKKVNGRLLLKLLAVGLVLVSLKMIFS